jgi:hypothetical protein
MFSGGMFTYIHSVSDDLPLELLEPFLQDFVKGCVEKRTFVRSGLFEVFLGSIKFPL